MRACFTQSPTRAQLGAAVDLLPALVFEASFVVNLSEAAHILPNKVTDRQREKERECDCNNDAYYMRRMTWIPVVAQIWHWGLQLDALGAIQLRMWPNLCNIDMPPCTSECCLFRELAVTTSRGGGAAVFLLAPNFIAAIVVSRDGHFERLHRRFILRG